MVIYKFFRINEYLYDLLISNQLYFSSIRQFNDPYDSMFSLENVDEEMISAFYSRSEKVSEEGREKILSAYRKNPTEFSDTLINPFRLWLSHFGICSFSKIKDNILMWSHYADKHRGVCLGFDHDILIKAFNQYDNVEYKNELIKFSLKDAEKLISKTLLTKSEDWQYEEEYRFFLESSRHAFFPLEALVEINFGVNCSIRNKMSIAYLANQLHYDKCNFYQSIIDKNKYLVDYENIDLNKLREEVLAEDKPNVFRVEIDIKKFL